MTSMVQTIKLTLLTSSITEVATIRLISPVRNFSMRFVASPGVTLMLGDILAFLAVTLHDCSERLVIK
jgi:hypothetical protein